MTPSFESHSQSSSSASGYWYSITSSDSCSMSGRTRTKSASSSILKSDLDDHILDNVSVAHFVEHVWGLGPAKVSKILDTQFQLPEDLLKEYLHILNNSTKQEFTLHKPFRGISRALLKSVCDHFDLPHTVLQTYFWDGNGTTYVSHESRVKFKKTSSSNAQAMVVKIKKGSHHGMLKPDLLEVCIPVDNDNNPLNPDNEDSITNAEIPTWALARAPVKFKKDRKTVTPKLDTVHEGKETGTGSGVGTEVSSLLNTDGMGNSSGFTQESGKSRNKRPGSPTLSKELRDAKKQRTMATRNISLDELKLANYALECLYAGNRHYVTGIFINGVTFRLWYYDHSGPMRTVSHDFSQPSGTANLAAVLFALSQSNMKQAGFNPYIYCLAGKLDVPIQTSTVIPLTKPWPKMKDLCYKFTEGNKEHVFAIHRYISRYRGINGRGTVAAQVRHALIGEMFSPNLYVLKMSWQFPNRKHEGEIISHLRKVLPDWHDHLPDPLFYTKITAEELAMPKYNVYNAMKDSATPPSNHIDDRDLHVIATNRYKHLWEASDIEEFKQAFIDCHYHAFQTGNVLHRDISENNLMIYLPGKTDKLEEQDVADNAEIATKKIASGPATESKSVEITEPRVRGVLNDFDMAVVLGPDGKPTTPSTGDHHITGTLPFMAGDLLMTPEDRAKFQLKYPTVPTYHLYRHDLESFFYILVWAATRYDLKRAAGCAFSRARR
uniref:Fungal-type protein kinase domain-containing protein n=1 Tax=Psilocybe cubensis TaxID=181762 RepID=A0A8H7XZA7_PSICU